MASPSPFPPKPLSKEQQDKRKPHDSDFRSSSIPTMSRDSNATYLHFHASHHADLLEEFTQSTTQLPDEDILVPPHLQPLNPEDEDDVVPDQHAAFGIQRATQGKKEVHWRDLGLEEVVRRAPADSTGAAGPAGSATGARGATRGRDEPVALALRRRAGARSGSIGVSAGLGGSEAQSGGGNGNGLPR